MSNFFPKIEKATDDELKHWTNETNPHYASLASDELIRRDILKLNDSIDKNTQQAKNFTEKTLKFNNETSQQTEKMIKMTKTVTRLTWVMVIGLIIQILLSINFNRSCAGSKTNNGPWKYTCVTNIDLGIIGEYSFQNNLITETPLIK